MKSFKEYLLTEASFQISKFSTVLNLFEKIISKKIGKIYRYGGDSGYVTLGNNGSKGLGVIYLYGDGSAFRLNYTNENSTSYQFTSVDVWKKFGLKNFTSNVKSDWQFQLPPNENIVSIINAIATALKNPKEGISVFTVESKLEDTFESELLTEKKKVEFQEFAALLLRKYSDISKLNYAQIKAASDELDITIPGVVWQMKQSRGIFDLTKNPEEITSAESDDYHGNKKDSTDLLLITRGGDGKFYKMEPADLESGLLKKTGDQINRILKTQELKEVTPAHILFEDLVDLVNIVAKGQRPSLMIVGGPGIGKTFTVLQTVKQAGLKEYSDYVLVKGKVTPAALYRTLFLNHDKLIVFDDSDSVFDDSDAVNILKAALDSYEHRIVSWLSNQTVNISLLPKSEHRDFILNVREKLYEDPEAKLKLPSEFSFTGRVIFISNRSKNKLDTAIISRSLTIDMTLTQAQILDRMENIMDKLGDQNQPIEEKIEVLDFLKGSLNDGGGFGEINMRTFVAALGLRGSGSPNWKRLLKYA